MPAITSHFYSHAQALIDTASANTNLSILFIVDDGFHLDLEGLKGLVKRCNEVRQAATNSFSILTNRYSHELALYCDQSPVVHQYFSDFNVDDLPIKYDAVYYRVSKEKPVVHHILNHIGELLKPGGEFIAAGRKNEGAKTYFDKTKKVLGYNVESRKDGDVYFATVRCTAGCNEHSSILDDSDYKQARQVSNLHGLDVFSKPGVYGWKKFDAATEELIELLRQRYPSLKGVNVLDLGCGSGYLSLAAAQLGCSKLVATDNNAGAVSITGLNLHQHFPGSAFYTVVASDCANTISDKFDLILCNPPFHKGFETSRELTDTFLNQSAKRLKTTGEALFVVNAFIPLEKLAKEYFSERKTLLNNGKFKVVSLKHSARI